MMYTSSPQTNFFKYLFPVFFLAIGIFAFFLLNNSEEDFPLYFAYAFGIVFLWNAIFLSLMLFRLKKVEADSEGLRIVSGNKSEFVSFKQIHSVSMFDLTSPMLITVKYTDPGKMEKRKTTYMPNAKYRRIMQLDEMSEYIATQSRAQNPNFEESSMIRNLLILFLAGLPFMIGMLYCMWKIVSLDLLAQ